MSPVVWQKVGVSWNLSEKLYSLLDEYMRENSKAVDDEIQKKTMWIPFPSPNLSGILVRGPCLSRGWEEEKEVVMRE